MKIELSESMGLHSICVDPSDFLRYLLILTVDGAAISEWNRGTGNLLLPLQ